MSVERGNGQPLNILKVEGRSIELDEHALARLLLDERVKDTPVVVLAVVGAFRKGKSFLMCFLLQFLRNIGCAEWLDDRDAPLEGFEWRGGSDRQTTGIMLWSEVFLVRNSVDEEFAVLLMDTQGTFDCQSPTAVHSSIFSLSAMISSVLVYNVSQNIQEDDLKHLKDFVSYGTQFVQRHSSTPAERLLFLVRDWQSPYEKPYGLEGGKRLLESRLEVAPRQDEELKKLREAIKDCFKRIQCFLMPHPGLQVAEEWFDGRLSDIDDKFIAYLLELVPLLLEPDNLAPKEINGRKITCQELMSYIKVYVNAHKRGLLQDPSSMIEATYVASCRAAMEKALDFYTTSMMTVWQWTPGDVDRETMRGHHNKFFEVALEKFEAAPKMGGQEFSEAYSEKLKEKMDATFDIYCLYLREKKKVVFNTEFFKSVAFKVVHGIMTTGLAAGAIALAVVELPIVAIALGAAGAASLSGHFIQVLVEKHLAKRKRKSRQKNSSMAAETAEWVGASTINDDDEAQLRKTTDDGAGQVSTEQPVSEVTSHEPPSTVAEELTTGRPSITSTSAGSASSSRMSAIERFDYDDRTPLLSDLDDCASVLSMEFPESENTALGPPDANNDSGEEETSKAVISAAFDRALKHYGDTMQSVCGEAVFRLSETELNMYHNFVRQSAEDIFARACYSAGKRVLREHLDRLADETEEQFKNFFNQNREKDALTR